jgi:hypothetical protein
MNRFRSRSLLGPIAGVPPMPTVREAVGAAAVVVGAAMLAAVSHHAGGQGTHARQAVESAAGRVTYREVSDAWARLQRGDARPLDGLVQRVPLPYRATHQEGDAVVVTFASQGGTCVDLVARPAATTVRTRPGC